MKKEKNSTDDVQEDSTQKFIRGYEALCKRFGLALESIPFDNGNAEIKPKLRVVKYIPSVQQE